MRYHVLSSISIEQDTMKLQSEEVDMLETVGIIENTLESIAAHGTEAN